MSREIKRNKVNRNTLNTDNSKHSSDSAMCNIHISKVEHAHHQKVISNICDIRQNIHKQHMKSTQSCLQYIESEKENLH